MQRDGSSSDGAPIMAFAEGVVLQMESDIEAAIALRAAYGWARMVARMKFNLGKGNSGILVSKGHVCETGGVPMGDAVMLISVEEYYSGLSTAREGATDMGTLKGTMGTRLALRLLQDSKVLVIFWMQRKLHRFERPFWGLDEPTVYSSHRCALKQCMPFTKLMQSSFQSQSVLSARRTSRSWRSFAH